KRQDIVEFLEGSDVYTQNRQKRTHFQRRKTIAYHLHELHQSDLCDLSKLAEHNKGYKFVLIQVDVLSKFVFYVPLKNKKPQEIIRAFKKIFKQAKPKLLMTDLGKEYTAKAVQDFLKKNNIHWYHTFSGIKASI